MCIYHNNLWYWGSSVDIVREDGTAIVCVKFDDTFPKVGYICNLSVLNTERKKGLGKTMMVKALELCREYGKQFARLHVNKKQTWLKEWYERLGFMVLSQDEYEYEMIKVFDYGSKTRIATRTQKTLRP